MPPKVASKPRAKSASDHITYQDMIIDAIVTLKERNGSSRVALKKYIKANNVHLVDGKMFDSLFNRALKSGVEKGVFAQPKGSSGGTKLAKKEPKPSAKPVSKPVDAKETEKKTTEKKATEKKAPVKKSVATKKATSGPEKAKKKEKEKEDVTDNDEDQEEEESAPKPKVSKASKSAKSKASKPKRVSKETPVKAAPVVIHRTKSGRIIKGTVTPIKTVTPKKASTKSKS